MLIISSDPKVKQMIEKGRKERSDAFWRVLLRVSFTARPKVVTALESGAAGAQGCPNQPC